MAASELALVTHAAYYTKNTKNARAPYIRCFHAFSSALAPVEADARVLAAPGTVLAPSNRRAEITRFGDCVHENAAPGAAARPAERADWPFCNSGQKVRLKPS